MKLIYNLDDIFCEDKAHAAVKQEIINILINSKSSSLDVVTLFEQARTNIIENIIHNYISNYYQCNNNFKSEKSIKWDKSIKDKVISLNSYISTRLTDGKILNNKNSYPLSTNNEVNEVLKDLTIRKKELDNCISSAKKDFFFYLKQNSSVQSIFFHKLDSGKYGIVGWIKPFLDRVTFNALSIKNINIENYDFTGTKGINIHSRYIYDNTLSNVVLNGAIVNCYKNDSLYPIDPTKVNITGTDFTGSKGAIVTLENVDKVPENCNLTDAIIIVNSRDDIKRFNLDKYGKNVYIKQDSIITQDKVIDYDFNDYLNYTGTIGDIQMSSINDALKLDGVSDEEIRIENNKIISYYIASQIASKIDFHNLYCFYQMVIKANGYDKDYRKINEERSQRLNNYDDINTFFNNVEEFLVEFYKNIGSLFKYSYNSGDKIKIFTSNGVFSIDLLRLGLSKEELELVYKGEKGKAALCIDKKIEVSENLREFARTNYDCALKIEKDAKEHLSSDSSVSTFILFTIGKPAILEYFFIEALEKLIYNNLEENNKGYSYAKKRIN